METRCFDNGLLFSEIADLLRQGRTVTLTAKGGSMAPFLVGGRDMVTLRPIASGGVRRGDVVLARTTGGTVVLHRVVGRQAGRLTLQGDANPLRTEQACEADVAGVATSFTRRGRHYDVRGAAWRLYSFCWMRSAPARRTGAKLAGMLRYMRAVTSGHRRGVALSCLTGVLSVALSLLFIYVSKTLIDLASGSATGHAVVRCAALLVLVMMAQLACDALDSWNGVRVQAALGKDMGHRLFSRLLRGEWGGLARFHTGDVVNRVERDAASVTALFSATVPAMVVTSVQFVAALAFFFYLDAWLSVAVVGVFPVLLLGGRFYMRRMYGFTQALRRVDGLLSSLVQESLQLRTVLRAFGQDARRVGMLDDGQDRFRRLLMSRTRFSVASRTCVSVAFGAGYLLAFLWGVAGLAGGGVTFGVMAAFLQLVGKVQRPMLDMARLVPSLGEAAASVARLRELEAVPLEPEGADVRFAAVPDVVVRDVTFAYSPGAAPVLLDFSCELPAGSRVAVTGPTGQGKTTLVRLLLALVRPQSGSVSLRAGGREVEVSPATRCNFAYVPQGNTLFSGSLRDNLLMGNPSATEADLRRALQAAEAGFVWSLPQGVDTLIGERAGGLSEGQAQRVAIARALLRGSSVFLFDEATSALDEATELRLLDHLAQDYADSTFVFVTHHAAVAARCDRVVRL